MATQGKILCGLQGIKNMKRSLLIQLHLYTSGVVLVLLAMFGLSGSLHLFGVKETEAETEVATVEVAEAPEKSQLEALFLQTLATHAPDYSYDYVKGNATQLTARPTTRDYYTFAYDKKTSRATLVLHEPSWNTRLMQLHMGHGVEFSRPILGTVGALLVIAVLTGLWLGLTAKKLMPVTLATAGTGLALFVALLAL
jgi:hypothetical protein